MPQATPQGLDIRPNSSFLAIPRISSTLIEEPEPRTKYNDPTYYGHTKLLPITTATLSCKLYTRTHYLPHRFQDRDLMPFSAHILSPRYDPEGWYRCVSPEGRPYYHHRALNIFTNLEVCIYPSSAIELEKMARVLRTPFLEDPSSSTLELVIIPNFPQDDCWGYYFANPVDKTIFWVDPIPLSTVLEGFPRFVSSNDHLGLELEAQYWTHIETFPDGREVTKAQVENLRDLITFAHADTATCSSSVTPYNTTELDKINTMLKTVRVGPNNREGTWAIARYMSTFKHEMFLHYYGEYGARLSRNEPVHGMVIHPERSYAFLCIAPLLFYAPDAFLRDLEEISVDGLTNIGPWNKFRQKISKSWDGTTTPITVLLLANVAVLASNIDGSNNPQASAYRAITEVACYVSTILSLACYIICWILSRRHREDNMATAQEAVQFLMRCRRSSFGVEGAALVYSLPDALFMWSMLAFMAAIVHMCMTSSGIITRSVTGILVGLMGVIVLAVLFADWTMVPPASKTFWQRARCRINRARQHAANAVKRMLIFSSKPRKKVKGSREFSVSFPVSQTKATFGPDQDHMC